MEDRKVILSLFDLIQAITVLEEFLKSYVPGKPICLTQKEKDALLKLLGQMREDATDHQI